LFLCGTFALYGALAAGSCGGRPDQREYRLEGQIVSLELPRQTVVLKHGEVAGFMPAMTMPYEVKDAKALNGLQAGDLVKATLVVLSNGAHLTDITRVGWAPVEKPPEIEPTPSAASGLELLKPGEAVPDAPFVDQNGRRRHFSDFRGSTLAITFIYTRCPLATFCPLMDRHFATMQKSIEEDPALEKAHLLTVSFDPLTDTPAVLKAHAKQLGAHARRWTFLTGERDDIDRFAGRFGVSVSRALNDPRDITHNLRTAIVGADGRLVKVYTGNDWVPAQLMADLRASGTGG
jgi:protein SCO1/2